MRKIFLLLMCLFSLFGNMNAQTIKTFTRNDAEITTELFNIYNGKETYSYYEDDNGNYVKNGAYSLTGSVSKTISGSKATENYKATATFKNDLMNGTLSILYTGVGTVNGKSFNVSKSFSAGYLNGIPNGKWTWKDNTDGYANSSEMTFTKGVLTGVYRYDYTNMNKESLTKKITKISGQLNAKGEFNGTWTETESVESPFSTEKEVSEMIFSNGVLLSCIKRDATGKLLNPDQDRASKKSLATKFVNGEITKEALYEQGYIFQTGKVPLYCPDLNNIGGDLLDSVVCGKPFLELVKVDVATDSLVNVYFEIAINEVEGNLQWAKEQPNWEAKDRMSEVKQKYSFEHYYRLEDIGASLYYKYKRYYLNSSQISKLDSLKSMVDSRVDSFSSAIAEEKRIAEEKKIAEEKRIAEEKQKQVEAEEANKKQIAENVLNYGISRIITLSSNPSTKIFGIDVVIRTECNTNTEWRNVFSSEVQQKRYQKPDGSYAIETPQEIQLKVLFHDLHPMISYKIVNTEKSQDNLYAITVEFEQKTKKKEPSKFYQGTIYVRVTSGYGTILLDYSLKDLKEVIH